MVDDPIALTNHPDDSFFEKARCQGKTEIFATIINDGIKAIYLFDAVKSQRSSYHVLFAASVLGGADSFWANGRITGDNILSREEFVSIIMDEYPDYFEWYLFHSKHMLGDELT